MNIDDFWEELILQYCQWPLGEAEIKMIPDALIIIIVVVFIYFILFFTQCVLFCSWFYDN